MRARALLPLLSILMPAAPSAAEAPAGDAPVETPAPPSAAELHPAPGYEKRVYEAPDLLSLNPALQDRWGPWLPLDYWFNFGLTGNKTPPDICEEQTLAFIRESTAPENWNDERASLRVVDKRQMIVVQTPEVHEKIARQFAFLRGCRDPQIVVEGTVAWVEDAFLDALRAGARDPSVLDGGAADALEEALAKGRRATLVRTLRATAWNGQRVFAADIAEHPYVYDVETPLPPLDPAPVQRMAMMRLGPVLDVRPIVSKGNFLCETRFSFQTGALPIPAFDTGIPAVGAIGIPEATLSGVGTTFFAREGETVLAGRVASANAADPPGTSAQSLCFFVRLRTLPRDPVPSMVSESKPPLRLFDVRLQTSLLIDSPGGWGTHHAEISCMDGIQEIIPGEALLKMVRDNVFRDTWEQDGNSLHYNNFNGFLFARNTPEVQDSVGHFLDSLTPPRATKVSTRAEVLAVDAAGYRAIRERYPSLAAGPARLDPAEAADLLARAAKGDGLSLAASGEVVGMSGQRVHVQRVNQQACATGPGSATPEDAYAPKRDMAWEGAALECRPVASTDGAWIHANVQIELTRLEKPLAVERAGEKGPRYHRPVVAATGWNTQVLAKPGAWMLAGETGPTPVAGGKRLLALVKFVPIRW
jgi:hypothetical protein